MAEKVGYIPSTMMVSTSPAPLRRKAAALSYSGRCKTCGALLQGRKLNHNETVEFVGTFHDLEAPAARQHLAAEFGDDAGHQVGILLVLDRIIDL